MSLIYFEDDGFNSIAFFIAELQNNTKKASLSHFKKRIKNWNLRSSMHVDCLF